MAIQPGREAHTPPTPREALEFQACFSDEEFKKIAQGFRALQMEDKWDIRFEDGWLWFLRSWTGFCIFALRLEAVPNGMQVAESWVNRNSDQYRGSDLGYERALVQFLIDAFLLGKEATFPMPPGVASLGGLYQHHIVGRAYPQSK